MKLIVQKSQYKYTLFLVSNGGKISRQNLLVLSKCWINWEWISEPTKGWNINVDDFEAPTDVSYGLLVTHTHLLYGGEESGPRVGIVLPNIQTSRTWCPGDQRAVWGQRSGLWEQLVFPQVFWHLVCSPMGILCCPLSPISSWILERAGVKSNAKWNSHFEKPAVYSYISKKPLM